MVVDGERCGAQVDVDFVAALFVAGLDEGEGEEPCPCDVDPGFGPVGAEVLSADAAGEAEIFEFGEQVFFLGVGVEGERLRLGFQRAW